MIFGRYIRCNIFVMYSMILFFCSIRAFSLGRHLPKRREVWQWLLRIHTFSKTEFSLWGGLMGSLILPENLVYLPANWHAPSVFCPRKHCFCNLQVVFGGFGQNGLPPHQGTLSRKPCNICITIFFICILQLSRNWWLNM